MTETPRTPQSEEISQRVAEAMSLIKNGSLSGCDDKTVAEIESAEPPVERMVNDIAEIFLRYQDPTVQEALVDLLSDPRDNVRLIAFCALSTKPDDLTSETISELESFRSRPKNSKLVQMASDRFDL